MKEEAVFREMIDDLVRMEIITITEACILELICDPCVTWDQKLRLIKHYETIIQVEVYRSFEDLLFLDMIDEVRLIQF